MIKKETLWLLIITVMFAGLITGLLIGQHFDRNTVTLSAYEQRQSSEPTTEPVSQVITGGKLNINFASVTDLMLLPGIGEAYAQRIVDYRTKHGPFMHTEDLLNVSGIGKKRLEAIAELITVGG